LLAPISGFSSAWQLVVISAVSGVIMAYLYGKFSSQGKIREVKGDIAGQIYEGVLFRHDLVLLLTAQSRLFWHGLRYASCAIKPLLILFIPSLILLVQLEYRFGQRGLAPNESIIVGAKTSHEGNSDLTLTGSENLSIVGPVRIPGEKETVWRVSAMKDQGKSGDATALVLSSTTEQLQIPFTLGTTNSKVINQGSHSILDGMFSASSLQLPDHIEKVRVQYPEAEHSFLGFSTNWLTLTIIVMLLSGFLGAMVLGITF